MLRAIFALVLAVGLFLCQVAWADTDVIAFLNGELAGKPALKHHRDVATTHEVCHRFHIPPKADGGDSWDCHDETTISRQDYVAAATASSSRILEVRNLTFDYAKAVSLPFKILISRRELANCLPNATISASQTASTTGTVGHTVTKTNGVSATVGTSVQMTASYMPAGIGGSSTTRLDFSGTVSTSTAVADSSSEAVTRSDTWTVTVPANTIGYIQMVAYQEAAELPFSATVIVDATLSPNDSGVTNASEMLTEAERSIPFTGILHLDGVSDGQFSTGLLPGHPQCNAGSSDDLVVTASSYELPAGATEVEHFLSPNDDAVATAADMQKALMKPASAKDFAQVLAKAAVEAAKPVEDKAAPNGLIEEILYTVPTVQRAPVECGFDQGGGASEAAYTSEMRRFMNFEDGILTKEWEDVAFKFNKCIGH